MAVATHGRSEDRAVLFDHRLALSGLICAWSTRRWDEESEKLFAMIVQNEEREILRGRHLMEGAAVTDKMTVASLEFGKREALPP